MDSPRVPQDKFNANLKSVPFGPAKLGTVTSEISAVRLERLTQLLIDVMQARGLDIPKDLAGFGLERSDDLTNIPGITTGAGTGADRRIGGIPTTPATSEGAKNHLGFDDPLQGHGNQRPRSTVVGPPSMPSSDDLTSQGTDYDNGSSDPHGSTWVERRTERSSADGSDTWGSVTYRDYGGNHWRVDYHDERHDDGTISSKETVFDGNNEPIKTTVREGGADGTATETTTTHETGATQTRTGTLPEIFPDRSQTGEGVEGGGGNTVAPRGWHNPITGVTQNPGLATNNNQVNPGREPNTSNPSGATPLRIDPHILVVNPAPDQLTSPATPKDIRADNPTIVDPPRPTS